MRKSLLALSVLTGALLASGAAMAGPVYNVDGINIPVGGSVFDTETSFENLVSKSGDPFSGIFKVQSIQDGLSNQTYSYAAVPLGSAGVFLTGVFSGFVTDTVVAPTATTAGTITFKGGQISYYVSNINTFTASSGTGQAGDFASAMSSTLFLSATPTANAAGDTLTITIPAGGTLSSFGGATEASATALLDVTGGDAGTLFNTNTIANSVGGKSDIQFTGHASSEAAGDFPVSGADTIKGFVLPEPVTISLFGAGLIGAARLRRKKSKQA